MPVFLGTEFALERITYPRFAVLRVKFTQDPLLNDPDGANDLLNVDNYNLTGPVVAVIDEVVPAADDPQAVDLILGAPLVLGQWNLAVAANVLNNVGDPFFEPKALVFDILKFPNLEGVPAGAVNDTVDRVLRQHFNPALAGDNWDALIAAAASGDRRNWNNARLAFDQLYLSSASSIYLDRRAGDVGQKRPKDIGMQDNLFRELVIQTTAHKLTQESFNEILEIFYGPESLRANITSTQAEPYYLLPGDDLRLVVDDGVEAVITFSKRDFSIIKKATAIEVATAINRGLRVQGSSGYAVVVSDPSDGLKRVRIYSGSLGLSSNILMTGGKALTQLLFAEPLFPLAPVVGIADWTITPDPASATVSVVATGLSYFDMLQVRAGDFITVYGTEFSAGNRGTFIVQDVDVRFLLGVLTQTLTIVNAGAVAESVTQVDIHDFVFYRPHRVTIHNRTRNAIVVQDQDQVDVILPATTQAVNRTAKSGAYAQAGVTVTVADTFVSGGQVTLITNTNHDFAVGDHIIVDDMRNCGRGFNGMYKVVSKTANTIVYNSPDAMNSALDPLHCTVTGFRAQASSIPGPFSFDPQAGVSITGTEAKLKVQLDESRQYNIMEFQVTTQDPEPALRFPDSIGYICLDFGNQIVGPIKYYGRLSGNELALDFSFRFPRTMPVGTVVSLLGHKGPFVPKDPESVGSFYATHSAAGRLACISALDDSVAGGITMSKTIIYPGDRGLGGDDSPTTATDGQKISDQVEIWGSNEPDADAEAARNV